MSLRTASLLRPLRLGSARLSSTIGAASRAAGRSFHTTRPAFVKVGDELPSVELMENSPGNKVDLAREAQQVRNMILIGVPAAFSGTCSATHVPSYINHPKIKDYDLVAVVSVNDVFVMKAWGEILDPAGQVGIRFLADPSAAFTKALDVAFDGSAIFGGDRSKRYTILIKDGKVTSVNIEPDGTGTKVSLAEQVLG